MGGNEVVGSTKFKYLGSIIQSDWEVDKYVMHQYKPVVFYGEQTTMMLFDKKFPPKLKCKFYWVAVRPALLYGMECCSETTEI